MIKAIPSVLAMGGPGCPELSNNSDGRAPLEHICKIFGYQVATYTVGNLNEFHRTIKFIGAIAHLSDRGEHPLVVHISFDGGLGRYRNRPGQGELETVDADDLRTVR